MCPGSRVKSQERSRHTFWPQLSGVVFLSSICSLFDINFSIIVILLNCHSDVFGETGSAVALLLKATEKSKGNRKTKA